MAKRCVFCGRKTDAKGRCQNQNCVDYTRTKLLEDAEAKKAETQDMAQPDKDESCPPEST